MSKVLLAAGLDLLREAEQTEADTDKQYAAMIKSGDAKKRDFTPIREGLRSSYQRFIRASEVLNYVRRAAIEAERLAKLKRKLAKLEGVEGDGTQQDDGDDDADGKDDDGLVIGNAAQTKREINLKRGLAAVSDDIVRNGVPAEVVSLCQEKMEAAFVRCEKIRDKENNLLLSAKDTDPGGKSDCSKSRPGFAVGKILAYHPPGGNDGKGGLQGNFTVTIPVTDGSYQVLVRNVTDLLVAAPDVSVQVVAKWGNETKTYKAPVPPGCAFLRSIGIVGGSDTSSIFVNVNSSGMRHSAVEVVVRQLVPAALAALAKQAEGEGGKSEAAAGAAGAAAAGALREEGQQQQATGNLFSLLPPIVPLGGGPAAAAAVAPPPGGVPDDATNMPPPPDAIAGNEAAAQMAEQFAATDALAPASASAAAAAASHQQPQQHQQQQQQIPITEMTPTQLKEKVLQLMDIVKALPDEVILPMNDDDDDNDKNQLVQQQEEGADAEAAAKAKQAADDEKLRRESLRRTADERAFEGFVEELPPPTEIMGLDDFGDIDMAMNEDDLREMEEALGAFG